MTENTKIEWADHTFNPWEGCTKISPACDNCYAAERAARFKTVEWGGPRRRTSAANWKAPIKWQKDANKFAETHGRRQRVFCASRADVFDNQVPTEWHDDLWHLIRQCPDLDWLLLTKRPQNIAKMKPDFWNEIKGSIWLGTTVENQEVANRNIPHLLEHDSAVRFLSCEPLLDMIDLTNIIYDGVCIVDTLTGNHGVSLPLKGKSRGLQWVIAGGESGPNARPTHPDWIRSLRDQCVAANTPFFFKQWGEWVTYIDRDRDDHDWRRNYSTSKQFKIINLAGGCGFHGERVHLMQRVGKKSAGRLLDGVEHTGAPK